MKKITLFIFLLAFSLGYSQAIPVTFDSNITVGSNWKADSGLTSVAVVDLPSDAPDHGNAGQIVSSASGAAWQNAQLLMTTNYIDLTTATGSKIITVDVYATASQSFLLKLEQPKNGTTGNTEKAFNHTGSGWETIAVDFSTPNAGQPVPDDKYKLLVFFPCYSPSFGNAPFDSTTYIDNVSGAIGDAIAAPTSVTVDFETPGIGSDWTWSLAEVAPTLSIIANPVSGGINTSANVAKFTASTTDMNWALCYSDNIGEFTFDATNSTVKIMVYKPTISNVAIKFEGLSPAIEKAVANTVINQWEELTIDFTAQIGNTYNRIVIIPDFVVPYGDGTDRTTNNTLYFDNIKVPDGVIAPPLPEPTAPATAPIHNATNNQVISIFSDAYANVPATNYNPGWGQSTVATIEMIAGNEVLKYAGLNYQGTEYTTQNVSGLTHLHVDYWTANSTTLDFFLISPGNEKAFSLPTATKEQWLSVEIPLSSFVPPVNLSNVVQFKVAGNGTVWLDNLYFYNSVALGTKNFEIPGLSVYPNPSQDNWIVKTQSIKMSSIQVFDILGKQVLSLAPLATEAKIDASKLKSGLYFAKINTVNGTSTLKLVKK